MSIHFLKYNSVYFIQPVKAGGYFLLSSGLGVAAVSVKQVQWVRVGYECNACNRKHGSARQSPSFGVARCFLHRSVSAGSSSCRAESAFTHFGPLHAGFV